MSLATSANGRLCCRSGLLPIRLASRAFHTPMSRRRAIRSITQHVLTTQLRGLASDGLVRGKIFTEDHSEWSMQSPLLPGRSSPLSKRSLRADTITGTQHWGASIAKAADQAPRRVTESANVLRIFVTCRKHRETKRRTSL